MPHRDPLRDFKRALDVTLAWEGTAAQTDNERHARTAEVCRAIAAERVRTALMTEELTAAERAAVAQMAEQAAAGSLVPQTRAELAEIGRLATVTAED